MLKEFTLMRLIIKKMKNDALMIMLRKNIVTRWLYKKGKFYSREKPRGIGAASLLKDIVSDENLKIYIYSEGRITAEINQNAVLVIK